jgi:hypothetical protein
MSFAEKVLTCTNCKKDFTFTVQEHELRASRGFPNEPGLCRSCRIARKTPNTQDENGVRTPVHSDKYFR